METTMLIASLRDVIQKQAQEIANLQQQLKQSAKPSEDEVHIALSLVTFV